MEEEDDDLYNPVDTVPLAQTTAFGNQTTAGETKPDIDNGEEEEVEVEEEEEDEYDIITEAPQPQVERTSQPSQQPMSRNETPRPAADGTSVSKSATASALPKMETPQMTPATVAAKPSVPQKPGSAYPAQHTSTIDVHANPVHPATGKPILSTDMDADFAEDDKPWRRPGTDISDYFNYGFDEFTWASYCLKQQDLRKEVSDQKKQLEEIQAFLGLLPGAGMPGMPTLGGTPAGGGTPVPQGAGSQPGMPTIPAMPGMPDMSPDMMQAMLANMMAQGLDPSSMDPMTFMQHAQAMMGGGQPGPGTTQGGQPGFGGQPPQGYGGQAQQMGYSGYDQRGGFGSNMRGKGMRRW
ncbi:hypothetical protein VTO42DRAFT_7710 [Malbranchea cinnamomea]